MALKNGLGRGLDSLITNGSGLVTGIAEEKDIKKVNIYEVEPDREQPRKEFDAERIAELAQSIKQYGVLQPLLVQKKQEEGGRDYFRIIAGERRWRAAKEAGLTEIPVIIKDYSSAEVFEISLIENIQREDLNPLEEALAYERLQKEYGLTQEEMAKHVGKSRPAIANSLRLLNLGEDAKNLLTKGEISVGHAKVLLGVDDEKKQKEIAEKVVKEGMTVRALENYLAKKDAKLAETKPAVDKQTEKVYAQVTKELRDIFGTKVNIVPGAKKSKIEIEYYTDEDLERIYELLKSIK